MPLCGALLFFYFFNFLVKCMSACFGVIFCFTHYSREKFHEIASVLTNFRNLSMIQAKIYKFIFCLTQANIMRLFGGFLYAT